MYFIELLIIHSLIISDEEITGKDYLDIKNNLTNVAHKGRNKNFNLAINGEEKLISEVLEEKLKELKKIARTMCTITKDEKYIKCVEEQENKIKNKKELPSNIVIDTMSKNKESFYEFCMNNISDQKEYFFNLILNNDIIKKLENESKISIRRREELESNREESYEEYINKYFLD